MTLEHSPVLEFPAWLYGTIAAIRRKVRAEGHWWAREYLKTGAFPQPRQMLQVPPGEVLVMHSATEGFDWSRPRWRMHMFGAVFINLDEGVPEEEHQRMRETPGMVEVDTDLKHRDVLSAPDFLRERLSALPPEDFEDISSADRYAVNGQLYAWDRELGRH